MITSWCGEWSTILMVLPRPVRSPEDNGAQSQKSMITSDNDHPWVLKKSVIRIVLVCHDGGAEFFLLTSAKRQLR